MRTGCGPVTSRDPTDQQDWLCNRNVVKSSARLPYRWYVGRGKHVPLLKPTNCKTDAKTIENISISKYKHNSNTHIHIEIHVE